MVNPDGQRESFWGVGPVIGGVTAAGFIMALLIDRLTRPRFEWSWLTSTAAYVIGAALMSIGVLLYLYTVRHLQRARNQGRLITDGPYRLVRHPLYAVGLLLICPGFCLLFRSSIVLLTPLLMAIVMRLLIPREERRLIERFGDEYKAYQRHTPMFIPIPRR